MDYEKKQINITYIKLILVMYVLLKRNPCKGIYSSPKTIGLIK